MKGPAIELGDATLGYGALAVLEGVDLTVEAGTFWGILGANGSGKTTLVRTILGLLPPLRGRLIVKGRAGGRPRFGYVPQRETLDPLFPLTGRDVAAMGAWRRLDWRERLSAASRRPLDEALAACGAAAFADERFSALSSGQKQRVLIARALASDAEIMILDEPLSGLDVPTQKSLLELLGRLKRERDLTVLMVSHRIRDEKKLFSHIAWVHEGRVDRGAVEDMLARGALAETFRGEL